MLRLFLRKRNFIDREFLSTSLRSRALWEFVLTFLLLMLIGASVIYRDLPLSPIDEHHHLDNVLKSGQLHIPLDNEKLGQTTLRIMSCSGIDADFVPPPCEQDFFDPLEFPDQGFNESAVSTPTYYVLTGLVARTARIFPLFDDLLVSARLANWGWMALAGAIVFHVLRKRGAPIVPAFSLVTLMVINPVALTAGVNVNPDGILPLAGILLLFVTLRRVKRLLDVLLLAIAAVLLVTIDGGMIIALVMCLIGLGFLFLDACFRHLRRADSSAFREMAEVSTKALLLLISFMTGPWFVERVRSGLTGALGVRSTPLPRDGFFPRPDLSLSVLVPDLQSFPAIRGGYYIPPIRRLEWFLVVDLSVLLISSLVVFVAITATVRSEKILGRVVLGVSVFALPITNALLWIRGGGFLPLSPRFVISILAVVFAMAGIALKRQIAQVMTTMVAGSAILILLVSLRGF